MAKKKPGRPVDPNSKRSTGEDRHTLPRVVFHVDPAILTEFKALAKANRRTLTAELVLAMENHLRASKS